MEPHSTKQEGPAMFFGTVVGSKVAKKFRHPALLKFVKWLYAINVTVSIQKNTVQCSPPWEPASDDKYETHVITIKRVVEKESPLQHSFLYWIRKSASHRPSVIEALSMLLHEYADGVSAFNPNYDLGYKYRTLATTQHAKKMVCYLEELFDHGEIADLTTLIDAVQF